MRSLQTKSGRLEIQTAEIERKVKQGFSLEKYKGLQILTKDEEKAFYLTIYRDSRSGPDANYFYRSADARARGIQERKESYDRQEAYKAQEKAKPREKSNCSYAVKEELKKAFPGVKFSVTGSSFSMGDSVRASWVDGPTIDQVEALTDKYQYGHFDGMSDMYENSNSRSDIPQTKYMQTSRSMSEGTRATLERLATEWEAAGGCMWDANDSNNFAYRVFHQVAIPAGAVITAIRETGTGSGMKGAFRLEFEGQLSEGVRTNEKGEQYVTEISATVQDGSVMIIDYSEKAIAVIGDTKPIKDKLKALGGSFNPRLTCGAGWIFRKSDLERVREGLRTPLQQEIDKTIDALAVMGASPESVQEMRQTQGLMCNPMPLTFMQVAQ